MDLGKSVKVFMRYILFLLLLLQVAGCSTTPQQLPAITGQMIIISRDTGFLGRGCTYLVFANGHKIGTLSSGEKIVVPAKNGENTVRIETSQTGFGGALCTNVRMARSVTMDGNPRFFRVGASSNFQIFFEEDTQ